MDNKNLKFEIMKDIFRTSVRSESDVQSWPWIVLFRLGLVMYSEEFPENVIFMSS